MKKEIRHSVYFDDMKYFFFDGFMYDIVDYEEGAKRSDINCSKCSFKGICDKIQIDLPECESRSRKDNRSVYFVFHKRELKESKLCL